MAVTFCPLVAAGGHLLYWPKGPSKFLKLYTKQQMTRTEKIQVSRCTLAICNNGSEGRRVSFTGTHHHAWNTLYV